MFRHFQPAEAKGETTCPNCKKTYTGPRRLKCPHCGKQLREKMEYVYKIKRTHKTHKTRKTRKTRKKPKPEAAAAAAPKTAAAPPTAAAAAAKFEDEFDRFFLKETAQSIDDPDEFDRIFLKETANADSLNQELKEIIETIPIAERIKYLQQTVDAFVQEDPFLAEQVLQQTIQTIRLIP